ncbi:hypothetical protein ACHHYP_05759 [Achlya hypogyna]|uniref:F-box/LRR-repeat protein 15-like leucin rich repeat domain-containing protein n=1 Tax=Achlya hypogyna TaxID=1202772 RepID=A0A1V9ZNK8_ACHHY|nr:hypothetical protein ACHHYP_05759 [Achlya hypogyna]
MAARRGRPAKRGLSQIKSRHVKPQHPDRASPSNQPVADQVLAHCAGSSTLDLRPVADSLDDLALVDIASRLSHLQPPIDALVLSGCSRISAIGVRSLAHAVGGHLKKLSYARSIVDRAILKVLATRLESLEELDFSHCPTLAGDAIREFVPCCNRTLRRADLSNCPAITDEGTIGTQGALTQCCKLLSLNLAFTTAVSDRGLAALAVGCRALQFISLEGLERVTDVGIRHLARGCQHLRLAHLKHCVQITDEALQALGAHCKKLQSVNVCGCVHITTAGVSAIVTGAKSLQVLDLQGCALLTEEALCLVAMGLPSLQHLNVNGCQQITENGLRTLAGHLPFVQLATTFRGLEPKSNATELKFSHHKATIAQSAALRLQAWYRGLLGRRLARSWRHVMIEVPAARKIQTTYARHRLRVEIAGRVDKARVITRLVTRVQAHTRGFLVRRRYHRALEAHYALTVATRAAVRVQTRLRGFLVRRQTTPVNLALARMYRRFEEERAIRSAVRVQRSYRRRLNRCRLVEVVGLAQRRRQQCIDAAIKLQRLFRARAARALTRDLRCQLEARRAWKQRLVAMAIKLQAHWRRHASWRQLQRARLELARRLSRQHQAATRIQALVRGTFGRQAACKQRDMILARHAAAAVIQRSWQRYLHPVTCTVEYTKLVSDIQWQLQLEAYEAERRKEALLERERQAAMRDSASEAESDDDWYAQEDGDFWFSPSRNEREYTRPNRFAREKSLVGLPIKVFWPLEDAWFEGRVAKFCASRCKHKIAYLDGDTEWLELDAMDETQLQLFSGSWMMYENYLPTDLALKAALYVHTRCQLYSTEYFCWRTGWIDSFDATREIFRVVYDDDATTMVDFELFALEDEVQVQDKRSLRWYHPAAYFFGDGYDPPLRVADYLAYVPPGPEAVVSNGTMDNSAWNDNYYGDNGSGYNEADASGYYGGGETPIWTEDSAMEDEDVATAAFTPIEVEYAAADEDDNEAEDARDSQADSDDDDSTDEGGGDDEEDDAVEDNEM